MTSKVLKKIATKLRFVYRPSKFVTLAFTVRHYFAVHRFSHILIAFHKKNAPCAFSHIYKKKSLTEDFGNFHFLCSVHYIKYVRIREDTGQ